LPFIWAATLCYLIIQHIIN